MATIAVSSGYAQHTPLTLVTSIYISNRVIRPGPEVHGAWWTSMQNEILKLNCVCYPPKRLVIRALTSFPLICLIPKIQ